MPSVFMSAIFNLREDNRLGLLETVLRACALANGVARVLLMEKLYGRLEV